MLLAQTQTWRDQRERRFQLDRAQANQLLSAFESHLPRVSYFPDSYSSFVVTTYFDTQARDYWQMAEVTDGQSSRKVRIREYLALCQKPGQSVELFPTDECFLEYKERQGEVRNKVRVRLSKQEVADVVSLKKPVPGAGAVESLRSELSRSLVPVVVSAYERQVFGWERGLRVTFDECLGFYAPPTDIYQSFTALTPAILGDPIAEGPARILEVKEPGDYHTPEWLGELLANLVQNDRYSKFRDGMCGIMSSDGSPRSLTRPIQAVGLG